MDPQTKKATLRFHVNPFVSWVWIGVLVLMSGALVSLWPEVALREVTVWGYARLAAGGATSVLLAILMATSTARAAPGLAGEARPHTLGSLVTPRPFDATPAIALACGAVIATLSSRGRGRARRNDRSRRA
jgi:hypothetical protein